MITIAQPRLAALAVFLLTGLASSCGDDDDGLTGPCTSEVALDSVLANVRANAVAAGELAVGEARELRDVLAAGDPDSVVDVAWPDVQAAFARFEPYAYGPLDSALVVDRVNAFPVDTAAVLARLAGDDDADGEFARGLPAIDFLVYRDRPDGPTTDEYALATQLAEDLVAELRRVTDAWRDAESWDGNTATGAGAPLSVTVNALSRHFEDARRDRLGLPLGITTLGFPNPQTVQAPTSRLSGELLAEAVAASAAAYQSGDPSLADYVAGLSSDEASSLNADIARVYGQLDGLLVGLELDDPTTYEDPALRDRRQAAYNALSRQVVNLKTDLPAVACVSITYVDNPSDSD